MDKMQMAHDYAMKCVGNPNSALNTNNQIVSFAWAYADAMQAEADKRSKAEAEQKRKEMREMLNAQNTFVEREGQHFDDMYQCEVDWRVAPEWAKWWAMDEDGECYWFESEPTLKRVYWLSINGSNPDLAPSFGYTGNWKESLRERPQ